MTFHWLGNLLEWIVASWRTSEDEDYEDFQIAFDEEEDDEASYEGLEREQTIRAIVRACVQEEMDADLVRVNMMGYCRALGAIGHMAARDTNDKQVCMEAAGIIAVTASCERMLVSIGNFKVVNKYQFICPDEEES